MPGKRRKQLNKGIHRMVTKNKFVSLNIPNVGLGSHLNSRVTFEDESKRPVERIQTLDIVQVQSNAFMKKNQDLGRISHNSSNAYFAQDALKQRRSTAFSNYGEKGTLFAQDGLYERMVEMNEKSRQREAYLQNQIFETANQINEEQIQAYKKRMRNHQESRKSACGQFDTHGNYHLLPSMKGYRNFEKSRNERDSATRSENSKFPNRIFPSTLNSKKNSKFAIPNTFQNSIESSLIDLRTDDSKSRRSSIYIRSILEERKR